MKMKLNKITEKKNITSLDKITSQQCTLLDAKLSYMPSLQTRTILVVKSIRLKYRFMKN